MGHLLFSLFLVIFSLISYSDNRFELSQESARIESVTTQRAIDTVRLINVMNDYIYDHPDVINGDGPIVLTNNEMDVRINPEINNIVFMKRVYVWQMPMRGLMNALKMQTLNSSLLGVVKDRRLIDEGGIDMRVDIPPQIPEGAMVYLN